MGAAERERQQVARRPKCSASIRRRCTASCRATESRHDGRTDGPTTLRARTPLDRSTVRLSVLIPVYNERDTIDLIVDQVRATPIPLEIICVDDCSTDGTQRDPRDAARRRAGSISCYRQPENRGKGAAIRQRSR